METIARYLRRAVPYPKPRPFPQMVRPQDRLRTVLRFSAYLLLVIALHTAAMVGIEGMTTGDALWLTLTTITTVGYGDHTATTAAGRVATVVLVYVGGIFVLFEAATTYFEYRAERRFLMRRGRWRWDMKDHILLLNVPEAHTEAYLCRLVGEFRRSRRFGSLPVVLVTRAFDDGLPQSLLDLGVVHRHGAPGDPRALDAAGARDARVVVVLAMWELDRASDAHTFDILHRLSEMGARGRILAECVTDSDRARLRAAGAEIVVRPLRGYPEMIVRAMVAPGAEHVMEDLFTSRGDECWRYDVQVSGTRWADLVAQLVRHDIGVPIAYRVTADGSTRCNPPPGTPVEADKLYVLVREGNNRPDAEIAALLAAVPRT